MTPGPAALVEALGWVATAAFVASYLLPRPELLVRTQMAAAVLWVAYGVLMGAKPVVAANLLVLAAAGWKTWRAARNGAAGRPGAAAAVVVPPASETSP